MLTVRRDYKFQNDYFLTRTHLLVESLISLLYQSIRTATVRFVPYATSSVSRLYDNIMRMGFCYE